MTFEDRYVVDLSDLRSIRFDCQCGASMIFKLSEWRGSLPEVCPSCHTSWHRGENTDEYRTFYALTHALRNAVAMMEAQPPARQVPFRVRFEMDRPKP